MKRTWLEPKHNTQALLRDGNSYSSTKMVSLGCPLAQKVAILSTFLLEFKQVMGKTYEFTQAKNAKHLKV
jgi:hypothetical protein